MLPTLTSHACSPRPGSSSLSPISARACALRTSCNVSYTTRRLPRPLRLPAIAQRPAVVRSSSKVIVCRATPSPKPPNSKLTRSIWTAVDVVALLGSVGGALAALLGVVSPTYALVLPLVLPVVSLIAALQREDLSNEEGRQYLSELSSSIGRDSTALLREAAAAIDEVRQEARNQAAAAARLSVIEDKLAVLEGAVVGAARSSREAAMGVNALGAALSQALQQNPAAAGQGAVGQQNAQMLAGYVSSEVVPSIRAELAASLGPWLAETGNGLKRLDSRLAVVEGSLAGLEMAQSEGLRRLSGSISSSLVDAESALQSSVRVEVATAVEPLKHLPQLVAAAAAKAAQQQQQQAMLPDALESPDGQQPLFVQSSSNAAAPMDQAALLEQLQELIAAEVASAAQQILHQQAEVLSAVSQPPKPAPLADDQWEALGRRLARLERLVQAVPELGEQAIAGQIAPLLAAQQQQQPTTLDMQNPAVFNLASMAELMGNSFEQLSRLIAEFEGVKDRLDDTARQITASNVSAAAADQAGGPGFAGADQLVQQLQDTVQQLLQQTQHHQQQPVQGSAAAAEVTDLMRSLQQQVQGLGAALQQVQMDIPVQIQLAFSQSSQAAAAARGDVYDGTAYEDSHSSNAAAAASAAATAATASAAAAQGIAEVRQLLGSVQQACNDLQVQVAALSAQVAAQQAALFSSQQEAAAAAALDGSSTSSQADAVLQAAQAAQQQLSEAGSQLSNELSGQLSGLCSSLEQQLQDLQQQLLSAATAAATQAAAEAAAAAVSTGNATAAGTLQQRDSTAAPAVTAAAAAEPYYEQAAAGGWAGYQQQPPGMWPPEGPPAAAAPSPQQPPSDGWSAPPGSSDSSALQQQQPFAGQAAGSASVPPQQQQQPAASAPAAGVGAPRPVIPDISSLTEEQLRTEGLRLLRAGRAATSGTGPYAASGPDFAAAELQLQASVACFGKAVESEPQDTRALGNLGNALLAQGELKKSLLDELRLSAAQGGLGFGGSAATQQQNLVLAETRLRGEAVGLLTRAGEIFRRVLEVDGWSSRALVNWGKALVGRAELAVDSTAATKLYNAAIDKFEAVLEEDPGMIVAKYRCALAMQGLAALNPKADAGQQGSGSRQRVVLLQDAAGYLSDIVAAGAGGDDVLRDAAAAALRQVQEQLDLASLSK